MKLVGGGHRGAQGEQGHKPRDAFCSWPMPRFYRNLCGFARAARGSALNRFMTLSMWLGRCVRLEVWVSETGCSKGTENMKAEKVSKPPQQRERVAAG